MMFWIKGEGLGNEVEPKVLERFPGVPSEVGIQYLDLLVEEGKLLRSPEGLHSLTDEDHNWEPEDSQMNSPTLPSPVMGSAAMTAGATPLRRKPRHAPLSVWSA